MIEKHCHWPSSGKVPSSDGAKDGFDVTTRHAKSRTPTLLLALLAALTLTTPARADNSTDDEKQGQLAAEAFATGKAAFARRDFVTAGKSFEAAALHSPHPAALLNAAEAWELAGKRARAAALCDLVLGMKGLRDAFRETAQAQLSKLTEQIATLEVVEPPAEFASVDGAPAAQIPFRRRLDPGVHKIVVLSGPSRPERSEMIDLAAGEVRRYRPSLVVPSPVSRPSPVWAPPTATWIAFGGAAAFGAVASIFGILTWNAQDSFEAKPTFEARDEFNQYRTLSNVSLAVSGAALIAGAVLWIVHSRQGAASNEQAIKPP